MEDYPVLDQVADPIHVRDLDGRVTYLNPAAHAVFGWPRESAAPYDPGDEAARRHAIETATRQGVWRGDVRRTDPNGNERVYDSHWSALKGEAGAVTGFFVLELDVTDRRLHDTDIMAAQRMESIGTLAGGIAHDINNVLGPILIGAEMIKRRVDDPWVEKKLTSMEEAAKRGAEIVKQVLDFARGIEGEKITIQVRHVLKEAVSLAQRTFSKSIEIKADLPRGLPTIVGDATQLRQAVVNLMINARDAMPQGGSLELRASPVSVSPADLESLGPHARPGDYVRIEVSDTGPGIPDEVADRIFEPFFSTKPRGQGTGLGLSTALTIVRGHKGFISVTTTAGSGTTFSVFIPRSVTKESSPGPAPGQEAPKIVESSRTILVVDDEPFMLEMNADMLESYGFQTRSAQHGEEGLSIFREDPESIDLVVTDINMPVMDGPTMVAEMRKIRPDVPVIAVSGLSEHRHQMDGTGLAGVDILRKPYTSDQLVRAVRSFLKSDPAPEPAQDKPASDTLSDSDFDAFMDGG